MEQEHKDFIEAMCQGSTGCILYIFETASGTIFAHSDTSLTHDHVLPIPDETIRRDGWLTMRNAIVAILDADHKLWKGDPFWTEQGETPTESHKLPETPKKSQARTPDLLREKTTKNSRKGSKNSPNPLQMGF